MASGVGMADGSQFADVDASDDPEARVRYLEYVTRNMGQYKVDSLVALGIEAGMTVLDVGCGAGDDVRLIAELVGPTGTAVGLDSSLTMVETAREHAADLDGRVKFIHGSAYELPFPDNSFDAARSDRVFQHLDEPDVALRELMRVTRPGGRVNVIDPDFGAIVLDTDQRELLNRLDAVTRRAWREAPGDAWMGRRLWGLFNQTGLEEIHIHAEFIWSTDLHESNQVTGVIDWARQAHEAGHATAEEVESWERDLTERDAQRRFFGGAPIFSVVGKVP